MHRPPYPFFDSRRSRRNAVAALTLSGCLLAPALAHAGGCWIDELPRHAGKDSSALATPAGQLEKLARDINAVFHRNPTLAALPEGPVPVRLRTRAQVAVGDPAKGPRPLWMQLRDHREELWVGTCGVHENSERIEPRASIVVHVDAPELVLERRALNDDQLVAWAEPPLTGYAGQHPVYYGWLVILSSNGQVPWIPVSMDEYLQFQERELQRAADEAAKVGRSVDQQDDASVDRQLRTVYENMKKFDPAAAEKMLADARAQLRGALSAARRNVESGNRISSERLAALRAFRATLRPDELRGQARQGWTESMSQEARQRLPLLVKLNPAWAGNSSVPRVYRGPQLIGLLIQGKGPFEAAMREVMQTLDYAALKALLAPAGQ